MTRRLLAATALTLVLAGCSAHRGSSASPVNTAAVAWADRVCASVERGAATLSQPPQLEAIDPVTARDSLVSYLGKVSDALDSVTRGINDAGPPPVSGGANAVEKALATITETKTAVQDARKKLAGAAVNDPTTLQQALTDAGTGMSKISNVAGPTNDLKTNPELNDAFGRAPTCRRLDGAP